MDERNLFSAVLWARPLQNGVFAVPLRTSLSGGFYYVTIKK
jgi:hypothetical protein